MAVEAASPSPAPESFGLRSGLASRSHADGQRGTGHDSGSGNAGDSGSRWHEPATGVASTNPGTRAVHWQKQPGAKLATAMAADGNDSAYKQSPR